jgi:hypothetical protein
MKTRLRVTVMVATAFVIVVQSRAVHAASSRDPCSLLTQQQVAAVLGANVNVGKQAATGLCEWDVPGQPFGIQAKKVTVHFLTERAWGYANIPVPGKIVTKTQVSGVGDQAVFGTTSGRLATITVKKGNFFFVVQIYGLPIEQLRKKEKVLALNVVAKL